MQRRNRHQTGHIYRASTGFHVRYYTAGSKGERVQQSRFLALEDDKHYITKRGSRRTSSPALKAKCDAFMLTVNRPTNGAGVKVTQFFDAFYWPYAKEVAKLAPSTLAGYEQVWEKHLKPQFGEVTLNEYRTSQGLLFLESLGKKYGKRVILHVKNLASAIFRRAMEVEMVSVNPWTAIDCRRIKAQPTAETPHYTLEEVEDIISALIERVDAQLLMALTFFAGLRPSEAVALQWGDIDEKNRTVSVRRACVRGHVGKTKTPESMTTLPLITQVMIPLLLWKEKCPTTQVGWIFPNERFAPTDPREFVRQTIKPILDTKKEITWKGLYAGRRGGATAVVELTGSLVGAQELLRHKSMVTTAQFYKKQTATALKSGLKLLEAASGQQK